MKKGVLAVVAASFLYGIMPIFTKRALMEGMTSGSVVFYRLFFSAIVSFIMLKILGINMQASARQIAEMVVMGIIFQQYRNKNLYVGNSLKENNNI